MKKLVVAFMFVIFANVAFGLTNSVLVDFNIFGNPDSLTYEGDTEDSVRPLSNYTTDNWVVWLNSSSQEPENRRLSYVTNTESKGNEGNWDAGNVMGVRVHFPEPAWNGYALIKPPLPFEIYGGEDGNKFTEGKGVIKNVGTIKSISSWVYGRNFLMLYYVNLIDEDHKLTHYPMGYLYFSGWKQLSWENPNYLADARDRVLKREPLYPVLMPSVKLDSLQFYRTKDTKGGNFITYVHNVTMEYEPYLFDVDDEDVNDEGTWGILGEEYRRRSAIEDKRIQETVELMELERRRIGQTDTATEEVVAE